jgi:ABC-type amino acid transport substrate-binding protein
MSNFVRTPVALLLATLLTSSTWADSWDQVREKGALQWGGDASGGGPYIYQGPENSLVGFEYELMEYVAAELGVRSEYVNWEWEMLPQKLKQGGIELVLNGYEWSEEHEREMSSTIPYYIYTLQLLARSDDETIRIWDDLKAGPGQKRKRVGALQGSAAARFLETEYGGAIVLKLYPE